MQITKKLNGEHHVVIPLHSAVKVRTLSSILKRVAQHCEITIEEPLHELDR